MNNTLLNNPMFIVAFFLVLILLAVIVSLFVYRFFARKKFKLPPEYQPIIFQITVPKEAMKDGDVKTHDTIERVREQISWAESLWAQIGGLKPDKGFKAWLYGRHDHLSLEIVARDSLIYFYVVVPEKYSAYFEQQLQAQYPHAQINIISDYNLFEPVSYVSAASLILDKSPVLAIKTYKYCESDPLNAITNALSKIAKNDGAAIQILIRPAYAEWRKNGVKLASAMQQGKNMKDALKEIGSSNPWEKVGKAVSFFSMEEKKENPNLNKDNYRLSPKEEEMVKNIQEKISKAGLEFQIRVVTSSREQNISKNYLNNILNAFSQYNIYEYGNSIKVGPNSTEKVVSNFIHRNFLAGYHKVLNTEELASLFHFPLPSCETPNIKWLGARKAPAPINISDEGVLLGKNEYRGKETLIRLAPKDRMRHTYIIGMTGTGKSTLMVNMIVQDIKNGHGCCYIDPHGQDIETVAKSIPPERLKDVIYFNPADSEFPMSLNMLEAESQTQMDFIAQEMINIFYSLMPSADMGGPMFEHYMRNALLLLMSDKNNPGTLVELPRVFSDEEFRKEKLKYVEDIVVKDFWEREFTAAQRGQMAADMPSYIISKVGRFIENSLLRNIIGQKHSCFNFREVMDNKKILLVNLSKGQIGDTPSNLLGLITVSKITLGALARASIDEKDRKDFFLYIDEFQNFITDSIAVILSEARKYCLSLNLAHQYIGQLVKNNNTNIKDAIFGNVGSIISYRIGTEDAEFLAKQFSPVFNQYDLMNIEKFNFYARMMIDNQAARPFSVEAMVPAKGDPENLKTVIEMTRNTFGKTRQQVEKEILEGSKIGQLGSEDKDIAGL
ncbi:MAG: type IV secretion system DNA-binding domain-containing protein [Patescibacteria group bacterium]